MAIAQIIANGFTSTNLAEVLATFGLRGKEIHSIASKDELNELIRSLAAKQTLRRPFYLLDLGAVQRLMNSWNNALPTVKPYYAVKCNDEPGLLATLAALGANYDCASRPEIEAVMSLGVRPEQILYANPCKQVSHIKYAATVGVNLTTFDSNEEIDKIKQYHPECALLLRIKINNDHTSWRQLGTKFGALQEEITPLLQHARDVGMKVAGVSFHVGSQASYPEIYHEAIADAKAVFDTATQLQMSQMYILNIGGGFKQNTLFNPICETINKSIQEFFKDIPLSVMAEPGRFFAETTFKLVTNIIGKRVRGAKKEYWIDDGVYGSFNLTVFDRAPMTFRPLICTNNNLKDNPSLQVWSSTVFGPTCDSVDTVLREVELPELELNDLMVFNNMGAYSFTAGSQFNGFDTLSIPNHIIYSTHS